MNSALTKNYSSICVFNRHNRLKNLTIAFHMQISVRMSGASEEKQTLSHVLSQVPF